MKGPRIPGGLIPWGKWLSSFVLAMTLSGVCVTGNARGAEIRTIFELDNRYRVDQLDWNIAGNSAGTNPNILSELTWKDLKIYQITGTLRLSIDEGFYLRGGLGYGWIFSGTNQDSDFLGNDRAHEYSRSNNEAGAGNVLDAALGVGYQFKLASGRLRLIPLVGYSYDKQNLVIRDGFQSISTPGLTPPYGPFQGLDSSYDAAWLGPWLGMDLLFSASNNLTLLATFEYHWADYKGEADWNLRNDLAHPKSFEHDAFGRGFLISAGVDYAFAGRWSLGLSANYQKWRTDPGTDRLFYATGAIAASRLNEVNWESYAFILALTCQFQNKFWQR
jgi:hypothetical protein